MGDIMGQIGQFGTNLLSGAEGLGSDVLTGIKDVGSSIGGLFGGGGAVSPGTLGATAATTANAAAPSMAAMGQDIAGAVPSAGSTAAAFEAAPGLTADALQGTVSTGMTPGLSEAISGAIPGGSLSPNVMSTMMDAGTGLAPGIAANPAGLNTGGNFLTNLLHNPKLLGAGGTALASILANNNQPAALKQLQQMEQQQAGFAKNQGELAQAEQQGLLPAGATNLFQGRLNAAEAAIRAKYAQMGMTNSSAEMQDLQAARDGILGEMFQQGQSMAAQGFGNMQAATGVESELLQEIMQQQINRQTALGQALAKFAGSFTDASGGTGT